MNLKSNSVNAVRQGIKLLSLLVLLSFYLIGTVEFSSFHAAFHPADESGLHSAINESNACHQTIYHNVSGKNCEHTSHIVSLKKCPLCHLTLQTLSLVNDNAINEITHFSVSFLGEEQIIVKGEIFSLDPARAPPVS